GVLGEVGHVGADPPALLRIPPQIRLAFAPGASLRVGGRPVVEDAPVQRPCPAPFGGHPVLFGVGFAAGGLVDAVGVDPAVDPAAAGGGAVVFELGVGRQR